MGNYNIRIIGSIYFLYCIFLYFLYTYLGFIYANEGAKYMDLAQSLNGITWSEYWSIYKLYFGYILYLKYGLQLFSNKAFFIFIQIFLNFIGGYLILQIVRQHRWPLVVGYSSLVLFFFCYPLQYWTLTLYTETSFVFLTLLLYYLGINLNKKNGLVFIFLSIFMIFWRPQGLHFILLLVAYLLHYFHIIGYNFFLKVCIVILIGLGVTSMLVKVDSLFYFAQFFNYEPFVQTKPYLHSDMEVKDNLLHAYRIMIEEIGWMRAIELQIKKIYWFLNMTRPCYSLKSNVLLFINSIVYFGLGLASLFAKPNLNTNKSFLSFTFFWAASCLVNVFLSYNDWHNRYNIIFIPFLCMAIGHFIYYFWLSRIHKLKIR
jgi:hypothetical protein